MKAAAVMLAARCNGRWTVRNRRQIYIRQGLNEVRHTLVAVFLCPISTDIGDGGTDRREILHDGTGTLKMREMKMRDMIVRERIMRGK